LRQGRLARPGFEGARGLARPTDNEAEREDKDLARSKNEHLYRRIAGLNYITLVTKLNNGTATPNERAYLELWSTPTNIKIAALGLYCLVGPDAIPKSMP
jgi:hypothetical protein